MRSVATWLLIVALVALPILAGCAPGERGYKEREAAPGEADPSAVSAEFTGGIGGPPAKEGSSQEPAQGGDAPEETGKEAPKDSDEGAGG